MPVQSVGPAGAYVQVFLVQAGEAVMGLGQPFEAKCDQRKKSFKLAKL
jgi:hypothetical protein